MPKFVQRHQSQLYLLPPDLRDWLPEDDLAHFVIEAVERVPLERFEVNERGTGSAQYHPRMMLALLVYCYANGIFGSRRIERATYRDIGVRYVAANCHPDHDTICTFRRSNFDAVAAAFLQVLLLAKELKLLRVGTVSVDGTKVDANANKRNSIRYDRAGALREQLRGEIEGLLDQAEHADTDEAPDPQGLPEELSRRDKLRAKLDRACAGSCATYDSGAGDRAAHQAADGSAGGEGADHLTDADSARCARAGHEYRQARRGCRRQSVGFRVKRPQRWRCGCDPAGVGRGGSSLGSSGSRRAARCRNWKGAAKCWWRRGRKATGTTSTGAAGADGEGAAGAGSSR